MSIASIRFATHTRTCGRVAYAVNPLARQGVATLFATHPPIAERVRRPRALDDDQALGLAA